MKHSIIIFLIAVFSITAQSLPELSTSSRLTEFEIGSSWTVDGRRAALTDGGFQSHEMQPTRLGWKARFQDVSLPTRAVSADAATKSIAGFGVSVDTVFPILTATESFSRENNLVLGSHISFASGYGDEAFGWISPDAGDTDATKSADQPLEYMHIFSMNIYAQYHFPNPFFWLSIGHSQLYADNMVDFVVNSETSIPFNRQTSTFANLARDISPDLRVCLEFVHFRTSYIDRSDVEDNRYQLAGWFLF